MRVGFEDAAGCVYAVQIGLLDVHEDNVWPEFDGPLYDLFTRSRLAHDLHVGLRAEHGAQPFPEDGVVVGYQNADGRGFRHQT